MAREGVQVQGGWVFPISKNGPRLYREESQLTLRSSKETEDLKSLPSMSQGADIQEEVHREPPTLHQRAGLFTVPLVAPNVPMRTHIHS